MAEALQEAFDELIPAAADKGTLFLQVIQQRVAQEDIGLHFVPVEIKKTRRFVLEATIQLGGTLLKGAPMKVVVHADPVGSSLQVGWQLTEEELTGILAISDSARAAHASRQLRNLKPENQRRLSGMLKAFHLTVFMPTMQQLVEAVELAHRPQGGRGFLGA
jgi:hypothetical protein